MADYKRTSAGLVIDDFPDDWAPDQVREFFDRMEARGEPFTGTYQEAVGLMNAAPGTSLAAPPQGPQAPPEWSPQPEGGVTVDLPEIGEFTFYGLPEELSDFNNLTDAQAQTLANIMNEAAEQGVTGVNYERFMANPDRAKRVTVEEGEGGRVNTTGILGAITRGAAPIAAGIGTGAAFGSVVPGIGTATGAVAGGLSAAVNQVAGPLLIQLSNKLFGRNDPTPQEAWTGIMDAMGVEAPDTDFERVLQQMASAAAAAGTGVTGMNAAIDVLARSTPLGSTYGQGVLRRLAAGPVSQVTGAAGSEVGLYGAEQLGEHLEAGPLAQAGLNLVGGISGDLLGGIPGNMADLGIPMRPSGRQIQHAQDALTLTNTTPGRAQAMVSAGDELGIPVRTDDIFPPLTPRQRQIQSTVENSPFGTMKDLTRQEIARLNAIKFETSGFEVFSGRDPLVFNQQLASSFIAPRQNAIDTLMAQKSQALSRVPGYEFVDVDNTIAYIDDQIEDLTRRGGLNADVSEGASTGSATAADAAQTNVYQPLIEKLQRWRAAFQNNTVADLEYNRAAFGDAFIPEGGYGKIATVQEREIVSGVYDNIRSDLTEAVRRYGGKEAAQDLLEANEGLAQLTRDLRTEVIKNFVQRVDTTGKGILDVADDGTIAPFERMSENSFSQARMMIQQRPEMITELALEGAPSDIRTVLPYLDGRGRDLMVSTILQDVMQKSMPNVRDLSANNFGTNLDRALLILGDSADEVTLRGVELTPEEAQRLVGLRNALDATRRSEIGMAASSPSSPTALLSTIPGASYGAARGIAQSPGTALPAWAGTILTGGALARAYQSPAMRDLLLEAATEGLPATRMEQIGRELIRVAMSAAYEPTGEQQAAPDPTPDLSPRDPRANNAPVTPRSEAERMR